MSKPGVIIPSFAMEVVTSVDHEKVYREAPERYGELGVNELILFDPDFQQDEDRLRWQRYRKLMGGFALVDATNADRVRSRVLGCFLRAVGDGDHVRLRLGTGPTGEVLVPTEVEAERAATQEEPLVG